MRTRDGRGTWMGRPPTLVQKAEMQMYQLQA